MIKVKSITRVGDVNSTIEVSSDKADNEFFNALNYLDIPRRTDTIETQLDTKVFWEEELLKRQQRNDDV